MKHIISAVSMISLLGTVGCTTPVAPIVRCNAVVESKVDLQGDYYSPQTGIGPGYQITLKIQRGSLSVRRLKLIVVGLSQSKRFGEVGALVTFDLMSPVSLDGIVYPEEIVGYRIAPTDPKNP